MNVIKNETFIEKGKVNEQKYNWCNIGKSEHNMADK